MYKGKPITPKPMGQKNIYMPPTGKPKGMGRKNPHSGNFTRNSKPISNLDRMMKGFDKINIFFTGQPVTKPVKKAPMFNNPFTSMMNTILKGK